MTGTNRQTEQLRAIGALEELMKDGVEVERFPLRWTVTEVGELHGAVAPFAGPLNTEGRRGVFDEWCEALRVEIVSEMTGPQGPLAKAPFTYPADEGEVHGILEFASLLSLE